MKPPAASPPAAVPPLRCVLKSFKREVFWTNVYMLHAHVHVSERSVVKLCSSTSGLHVLGPSDARLRRARFQIAVAAPYRPSASRAQTVAAVHAAFGTILIAVGARDAVEGILAYHPHP